MSQVTSFLPRNVGDPALEGFPQIGHGSGIGGDSNSPVVLSVQVLDFDGALAFPQIGPRGQELLAREVLGHHAPDAFRPRGLRVGVPRNPLVERAELIWLKPDADQFARSCRGAASALLR